MTTNHSLFIIRHSSLRGRHRPRGMALLLCIFILSIITVWLINMLDTTTTYTSALRNTIEYEQSLYLANAGVHDAVAQLESNTSWVGTVTAGSYPASGSYSATAATGGVAGTVTVTSFGVSGATTRKVVATVQVQ
ncbi:MAG TPA: hypothetical protein VGM76_13345 [Lacipirellulaceae bacterium]